MEFQQDAQRQRLPRRKDKLSVTGMRRWPRFRGIVKELTE